MHDNLSPKAKEDFSYVRRAVDDDDQAAYAKLHERYKTSIYHMMLKMVHNHEDANDLTLEAFGKAFNKLHNYQPKYAFSTWLFKIAINNCIDHIRKKKMHFLSIDAPIESEGSQDYSDNIRSDALDPEEAYIRTQKVKLMRDMMMKLDVKYRLMIELRFFEDLSYEQIAEELEIPLGTVKAQLFRAKAHLSTLMKKNNADSYLDEGRSRKKKNGK